MCEAVLIQDNRCKEPCTAINSAICLVTLLSKHSADQAKADHECNAFTNLQLPACYLCYEPLLYLFNLFHYYPGTISRVYASKIIAFPVALEIAIALNTLHHFSMNYILDLFWSPGFLSKLFLTIGFLELDMLPGFLYLIPLWQSMS